MFSLLPLLSAVAALGSPAPAPVAVLDTKPAVADGVLDLTFGVYLTDKATTLYRQFTPILEVLQGHMERDLQRSVNIELKIYRTYDEGIDALATGAVDFVRFGPASYVIAQQRQPELQLLAMEQKHGKKRFHGVIVVRADSDIHTIADLRGKRFAFGDENSTIGRYLAQDLLVNSGITASDLGSMAYLGRHDKVAAAVAVGDFDAGALKKSTLKNVDSEGRLRVLVEFENVTKPWIARAGLDPSTAAAIRSALLSVTDEEALNALGVSGFFPACDEDYAFVRKAMLRSRRFDGDQG